MCGGWGIGGGGGDIGAIKSANRSLCVHGCIEHDFLFVGTMPWRHLGTFALASLVCHWYKYCCKVEYVSILCKRFFSLYHRQIKQTILWMHTYRLCYQTTIISLIDSIQHVIKGLA